MNTDPKEETLKKPGQFGPAGFRLFAELVTELGEATKTNDKLDRLANYFATAIDKDKVWVIALFTGRRPKRAINATQLRDWCMEMTSMPEWLFEECYQTVGDLPFCCLLVGLSPKPNRFTIISNF